MLLYREVGQKFCAVLVKVNTVTLQDNLLILLELL